MQVNIRGSSIHIARPGLSQFQLFCFAMFMAFDILDAALLKGAHTDS